jgi:hypothetical protein
LYKIYVKSQIILHVSAINHHLPREFNEHKKIRKKIIGVYKRKDVDTTYIKCDAELSALVCHCSALHCPGTLSLQSEHFDRACVYACDHIQYKQRQTVNVIREYVSITLSIASTSS